MSNIVSVIGFVAIVLGICKVWSLYGVGQYKKAQKRKAKIDYGFYMNGNRKIEIAGIGNDENGDYKVSEAIKNIKMPSEIRIKSK